MFLSNLLLMRAGVYATVIAQLYNNKGITNQLAAKGSYHEWVVVQPLLLIK